MVCDGIDCVIRKLIACNETATESGDNASIWLFHTIFQHFVVVVVGHQNKMRIHD